MVEDKVAICFDEENKIRVLDPKAFKHSEELERECKAFVSKMQDFSQSVSAVVEVLDCHAKHIEREKLRAIGMRNMVDGELERRAEQKAALQVLIKERMADLDRHNLQYQSLLRMEADQEALIERLSNSETLAMSDDVRK